MSRKLWLCLIGILVAGCASEREYLPLTLDGGADGSSDGTSAGEPIKADAVTPQPLDGTSSSADVGSLLPDAAVPDGRMPVAAVDAAPSADGLDGAPDTASDAPMAPPPACTNLCPLGRQQCGSGGPQSCITMPNGCTDWGPAAACPAPQSCSATDGRASCACAADGCPLGHRECSGRGTRECVRDDACTKWSPVEECPSEMTCSGAGDSAQCRCPPGTCDRGSTKCGPGGGVQTCDDGAQCPTWSAEVACASPQSCTAGGHCSCPAGCSLGATQCGPGGGTQTCVRVGECNSWGSEVACTATQVCRAGTCSCPEGLQFDGVKCVPCGGVLQACCRVGNSCQTGYSCNDGSLTCRDVVTITSATFSLQRSTFLVNATSSDPSHGAILVVNGVFQMMNHGDGTYSFGQIGATHPGQVTVVSSFGGAAMTQVMDRP